MEKKFLIGSERQLIAACVHEARAFDALTSLPTEVFCDVHKPIVRVFKAMAEMGMPRDTLADFETAILNREPQSHDIFLAIADLGGFDWESRHLPQINNLRIANKMIESVVSLNNAPADEIDPILIAQGVVDALAESSQGRIVGCADALSDGYVYDPIPTGFDELDKALDGGVNRGSCLVVGARPRVGKTAFATSMAAVAWLRYSVKTLFISAEMSPAQLHARVLSASTSIRAKEFLRKTPISDKAQDIVGRFSSSPIKYYFKRGMTVEEACGVIHMVSRQWQGQKFLVVVDYLQRLNCEDQKLDDVRKVQKVAMMLSDEATRSNVPLIALAQLNRGSEQPNSEDKLSDLKGAGAIEEMADTILFIKRDWDFRPELEGDDQDCSFKLMKNRGGSYPELPMRYTPDYTRFSRG
jgi:KaiC/GvpD/RAD55 family RecA-like ATPase